MAYATGKFPPCVLVTAGDAWGSILGMARSLGRRGVRVFVVVLGQDPTVVAHSRYCHKAVSMPLDGDAADMAGRLTDWWAREGLPQRPLLVPMSDRACTFLAQGRESLAGRFNLGMAQGQAAVAMLNKQKANELARANGLEVPQFGVAGSPEELRKVAGEITFPVIIKPTWWRTLGQSRFKTLRCDRHEALLVRGGELIKAGATILIQQYVPGGDESVEVYMFYRSRDGRTIYGCTGRKIRQVPPGAGIMASGQAVRLPHVAEISRAFLEAIDYRGLGGIEYKRCGGKHYFIEMSVRPEGFHPLAIQAGVDLPWYAYCDLALNKPLPSRPAQKKAYWFVGQAYLSLLKSHRPIAPIIREAAGLLLKPSLRCAIWSVHDSLPWAVSTWRMIKVAARKVTSRLGQIKICSFARQRHRGRSCDRPLKAGAATSESS